MESGINKGDKSGKRMSWDYLSEGGSKPARSDDHGPLIMVSESDYIIVIGIS